jgi:hypothetical protein
MADDAILKSMRDCSDDELLDITSGAALNYTDHARRVAEAVLRERHVELPLNLDELRKLGAAVSAEVDRLRSESEQEQGRAVGRAWGVHLAIFGVSSFILAVVGPLLPIPIPFGEAIPIAAFIAVIGSHMLDVSTGHGERSDDEDVWRVPEELWLAHRRLREARSRARTAAESPLGESQEQTADDRPAIRKAQFEPTNHGTAHNSGRPPNDR